MPLMDGATTNVWCLPGDGAALYPITDFGRRSIIIARSVDWSSNGRSIYAAVAEILAEASGVPVVAAQAFELSLDPPSSGLVIGISHEGGTAATNAARLPVMDCRFR